MKKWLFVTIAVLASALVFLLYTVSDLRDQNHRLNNNQTALLDSVRFYQTENDKNAASVRVLQLSKAELEESCLDLNNTISDLNVKLSRVESAARSSTNTSVNFVTVVKDSIVYRYIDGAITHDTVKSLRWSDPWVSFKGELYKDSLTANISSKDTLTQIVHRVPKRFLFIKYGTKYLRQEVVSQNPHTRIVYSEYIDVVK